MLLSLLRWKLEEVDKEYEKQYTLNRNPTRNRSRLPTVSGFQHPLLNVRNEQYRLSKTSKIMVHVLITSTKNSNLTTARRIHVRFGLEKIFSSLSNTFCKNEMKRELSSFDYILYSIKREANKRSNISTIITVLVFISSLLLQYW